MRTHARTHARTHTRTHTHTHTHTHTQTHRHPETQVYILTIHNRHTTRKESKQTLEAKEAAQNMACLYFGKTKNLGV